LRPICRTLSASPVEIAQVDVTLDVLFVHAGDIHKGEYKTERPWSVYSELPRDLPRAREYWLVFRYTRQGVPDDQVAETLGREDRHLHVRAGKFCPARQRSGAPLLCNRGIWV
jgi:hypothetical protein